MAKLLKLRRGTTSQHSSFTGAEGEVTVDTDKEALVVHNGSQAGGFPVARADGTGVTNFTITGELDAATLDISGNADIDGTLEADAITVDGTALDEYIADTVGAMVTGNTETGISVTYEDSDNTLDFAVGTASAATEATNVTVVANNSTDETVYPTFVDGATGTQGIETDTGLTYNPSTGLLTAVGLTLSGDLTVGGTTTTINSTTLSVDDKNIELGSVSTPSDTTADGGGITLKGATDKTFNWVNATDAWTSSEHINLVDNKKLLVGTDSDLGIYHDASDSYINNTGTGNLYIVNDNGGTINLQTNGQENAVKCIEDGAVELYWAGTSPGKKLETTQTGVTVTGTVSDSKGDLRNIPLVGPKSAAYTLIASDAGKHVRTNSNIEVPANVLSEGDAVTIINASSGEITITQGSGQGLWNSATAVSGNKKLAGRGMATILFSASGNNAYMSGAGLSDA